MHLKSHQQSIASLLFLLLFSLSSQADWYSDSQEIMGTHIDVELWHDHAATANQAITAVMAEMRRVEQAMSPHISRSELYRINRDAAAGPVAVSRELFDLIARSLHYSSLSRGAFDISFASVGRFYDYRKKDQPTSEQLQQVLPAINYRGIKLDRSTLTVHFLHPALKIDLGGIAKGHAVDRSITLLQQRGIKSAIVTAGGDSRILGDRYQRPWMMGIRHPRKPGEFAVKIPLVDTAISTSGDYERFFLDGERRVHHILNPRTGQSASRVQSVSILAAQATDSDALSTTVFVLGIEEGLELINTLPGIDAIIIDNEGKLHYSQDLLMPEASE